MNYQKYDYGNEALEIIEEILDTLGLANMPIGAEIKEKLIRSIDLTLNGVVEREIEAFRDAPRGW